LRMLWESLYVVLALLSMCMELIDHLYHVGSR
jgi:hypothetical protein